MLKHTKSKSAEHDRSDVSREANNEKTVALDGPPQSTRGDCDRVEKFLHGLKLVISHHGAPSDVIASFYKQAYDYLKVDHEEVFLKRAKYLILVPMAKYLRNEMPAEPDVPFEARGSWKRWSAARIKDYRKKNTHLWYSFLQAKRAGAPVSNEIVLSNFEKHRKQMLSPDPIGDDDSAEDFLDSVIENIQPVLNKVSRLMKTRALDVFRRPEDHTYSASQSASHESARSKGGQKGFLRKQEKRVISGTGELLSMKLEPSWAISNSRLVHNKVVTTRIILPDKTNLSHSIYRYTYGNPERLPAKVEAVLEPFKVRTISKGPAVEYDGAKPIQKELHSILRDMSPFRLIGKPFCSTDLIDVRRAQEKIGSLDEHYWLSVDYSAATDGLSAKLSRRLMEGVLGPLAFENYGYYKLLLAVLAPHRISYPEISVGKKKVQLEDVDQQNGQLMGSILSFPILCLANLALYLTVRKATRPKAEIRDLLNAVLVNGDDMIYIGTKEEWKLHQELGKKLGLEISPGKAYIHKRYANINSVSVDYDLTRTDSTPYTIPFLNVGLMVGNHKVMAKVGSDDSVAESPTAAVVDEVVKGAWGNPSDVLKMYLAIHANTLRKELKGRNLFLPISAGGLGQTAPPGFRYAITKKQLRIAGAILSGGIPLEINERPLPRGRFLKEIEQEKIIDPLALVDDEKAKAKVRLGPETTSKLLFGFVPYMTAQN